VGGPLGVILYDIFIAPNLPKPVVQETGRVDMD